MASAFALCAVLLTGATSASAVQFTFVNDPVTTDTPPFIQLLGINNADTIVGYTGIGMMTPGGTVLDPNRGIILTLPNTFTSLNPNFNPATCNICQTQVFGITTAGTTTAGFYIDANNVTHGFLDIGNLPTARNVDNPAGMTNQLLGLNGAGTTAAGFYTDAMGNDHGYTYNTATSTFTALPVLPNGPGAGDSSQATGVNNAGWITGFDATTGTAFLYNPVTNTYIPINVPGAMATQALSLNDANTVVGDYTDAAGVMHGFIWTPGIFTTIDPNGSTATVLQGINDLNQIVGFYTNANNATIGLVTSIPEPSTFVLLATGFSALVIARRRRRSHSI